jgi:hypothetical protein
MGRWYRDTFGILVTCFVALLIAGLWWVVRPGSNPEADLTQQLGIEIPSTATDVHVDDPRIAVHGSCSSLEFLIPTSNWQAHVGRYFDLNSLEPTYDTSPSCGHTQIACARRYSSRSHEAYRASDRIDDGHRGLRIFPDCFGGETKIAWSMTD